MSKLPPVLAVLLAAATATTAQQPQPIQPPGARPADPALAPIPTDSFAFVSVKASKLWDNPAAKPLRDWVAAQKDAPLDSLLGVAPADLDRLTLFLPTPPDDGEPLLLVTTRKPYNEARMLKALGVGREDGPRRPGKVTGRVFEIDGPLGSVALLDDRTLLFVPRLDRGAGPVLVAQLVARKPDGPLAAALIEAQAHDFTAALDVRGLGGLLADGPGLEKELAPFLVLLQAKSATLTADFDKTAKIRLVMNFPDAATAKRAAPVLEEGMKTLAEKFAAEKGGPAFEKSWAAWGATVLKGAKATATGNDVVATADVPYADDLAKLAAALPKSLGVARGNARAINNLKQLALAFHNYEGAFAFFPSDVAPGGDKAMSWRVQILPFVEQENLYKQVDMTKPWDDPANLKVLEAMEMPKVFEHPGRPAPKGHTYFRVFSFPKGAKGNDRPFFEEGKRGPKIGEIPDGTSNTLMIVEAGEAVPWYKPDVLAYDGKLPLPQLGDKEADLFLAAMADGSVRTLRPSKVGEVNLRALITRAGGEVVVIPDR